MTTACAPWPERDDPQGFAAKMNGMPKYVVSSTLKEPRWTNSTVIGSDVATAVPKLKTQVRGTLLVAGSRALVHGLMAHDLVDEYRLMVFPVILGSGRRLYPETPRKLPLKRLDTRVFTSGVVVHHYAAAR